MKKQFIIFFIFTFILGLIPVNFSLAITQNQINAEVQIVCPDNYGNWFSGSGTIIDPKGIILTNKHVVSDQYGTIIKTCVVGFVNSISKPPDFGTAPNFHIAEVKFYTTTNDLDAAVLFLINPTNKIYPSVNIWNSDSSKLTFGDKIEVIGFPSIGGSTITYTSGDFSGFGSSSDGTRNYIKTTAPLEHGNSGGSAYNALGQFVGIPTMVVSGPLNSISYILSVNPIKQWLATIAQISNQQDLVEQAPPDVTNQSIVLQSDIKPPNINSFKVEFLKTIRNNSGNEELTQSGVNWSPNYVVDKYNKIGVSISGVQDDSGLAGYYYYFGKDLSINPVTSGKYIQYKNKYAGDPRLAGSNFQDIPESFDLPDEGNYYFIIAAKDSNGNVSLPFVAVYKYEKDYYKKIQSISFYKDSNYKVSLGNYKFSFIEDPNEYLGNGVWSRYFNNFNDELTCKTRLKNVYVAWNYPVNLGGSSVVKLTNKSNMDKIEKGDIVRNNRYAFSNLESGVKIKSSMEVYGKNGLEVIQIYNPETGEYSNQEVSIWQEILNEGDKINDNFYVKPYVNNDDLYNKNKILNLIYDPNIKVDITCISKYDLFTNKVKNITYNSKNSLDFYHRDINYSSLSIDEAILPAISSLNGRILLQVESHGEAWYVYPGNQKRYYLGRPKDAFDVMRRLGLGVKHDLIENTSPFPTSLIGKILLDVESHGEAYYIYPKDRKKYYLGSPDDAFNVMRSLGLGISNANLNKILVAPDSTLPN